MQQYQEEQKTQWAAAKQNVTAAKQSLDTIKRSIQDGNAKQRQLATGALADLPGLNMPPCPVLGWVLGNLGRGQQGPCPPRAQGLEG